MLAAVVVLLVCGILTLWIPGAWAFGLFQAGAFLLGIAWIAADALWPDTRRLSPALLPLAGVVTWPLLQLAAHRTVYRLQTWNAFWMWAVNFLLFFLASQLTAHERQRRRFVLALLWFGFVLAGVSTLQMFTSTGKIFWLFPSGYTDFVLGPFVNRNQYSAFIELTFPIAFYFAFVSKKHRLGYAAVAAGMLASVIASASRAGTVLVFAEVLIMPLLAVRMHVISGKTARTVTLTLLLLGVTGCLVVGFGSVWQRFLVENPAFLRSEVTLSAAHMLRDRPGMGFGLGTWTSAYPQYARFDPGAVINQAHNDWLQWGVEGGVPFLALMLVFAALLLRPALHSLWGIGVLFVLIHCLVDYPLQQRPAFAALFFAVCGAVAADRFSIPQKRHSTRVQRPGVV